MNIIIFGNVLNIVILMNSLWKSECRKKKKPGRCKKYVMCGISKYELQNLRREIVFFIFVLGGVSNARVSVKYCVRKNMTSS